jgi:crossover junction endodeoxyribonuclease RusA
VSIKPCKVILDWPAAELFPNRSNGKHWATRQPFKVAAKQNASSAAFNTGANIGDVMIDHGLTIIIEPPDKRRRDVDGVLSALKPSLDGLAAALGIDDERFNPVTLIRMEPVDGGRITIIVDDSIPF